MEFEFINSSGRIAFIALAPGVSVMSSLEEAGLVVDIFPSHGMHTTFTYSYVVFKLSDVFQSRVVSVALQ